MGEKKGRVINQKLGTHVEGFANFLGTYVASKIVINTIFNIITRIIGFIILYKVICYVMEKV